MAHSKTKFQAKWLTEKDKNRHDIGSWCVPTSNPYIVQCRFCGCDINCSGQGCAQLKQHSATQKHRNSTGLSSGPKQTKFVASNISNFFSVSKDKSDSQIEKVIEEKLEKETIKKQNKPTPLFVLSKQDVVLKSEVLWLLKVCSCNFSYASCEGLKEFFRAMFPDSLIAQDFQLSRTKASYVVGHGLGPYFIKQLVNDIRTAENCYFTLHFDETTTVQIKKQMDLLVRYYSDSTQLVEVKFLKSLFFGHAYSENVAESIRLVFEELALPLDKLLSISTDGPNVNKSIKRLLDGAVKDVRRQSGLIDIGFCSLHVVSNAFRKAMENFGKNIEDLVIDLFYFFRLSSARREDYAKVQSDLGFDESLHFVRHVQSRWLTLIDAVERIAARYEATKEFFLKSIPSNVQNKDVMETQRYRRIVTKLKDDETLIHLHFVLSVKPVFDSFLVVFQTKGPMVHCLHSCMVDLIKTLLRRFMKTEQVTKIVDKDLKLVDVSKDLMKLEQMEIGPATRGMVKNLKSQRTQLEVQLKMQKFYQTGAKYLCDNLPVDNAFLKALGCLHPQAKSSTSGPKNIQIIAEKLPATPTEDIVKVCDEWRMYAADSSVNELSNTRIDEYWSNVLRRKTAAGIPKYHNLGIVVKCALTLSHGNADSERGLSINKRMLGTERTPLSNESINGIRACKDAVEAAGGKEEHVPITRELLSACRAAHQTYKLKRRSEQEIEENKKREEDAKQSEKHMKETAAAADRKERLTVLKQDEEDLKDADKKLDIEYKCAKRMLKEANEYLKGAIKGNDTIGIKTANKMIEDAEKQFIAVEDERENLAKKRTKIMKRYKCLAK